MKRVFFVLCLMLISVPVVFCADKPYSVTGTVVDELGNPVENVEITVYDVTNTEVTGEQGTYYGTVTTDGDGYFKARMDRGSYNIVFEKTGYVSASRQVSFQSSFNVKLDEIELEQGLVLSLSSVERMSYPGSTVSIPFTFENRGETAEQVELVLDSVWSIWVEDVNGKVSKVWIQPDQSLSLKLLVEIPLTGTQNTVSFTANGHTSHTREITLNIETEIEPIIGCVFPGKQSTPGSTTMFSLTASNPFDTKITIDLALSGFPENWYSHIISADGEDVNKVTLEPGESETLLVVVEIPETAEYDECSCVVEASIEGYVESLVLELAVVRSQRQADLQTKYPDQSVELGKQLTYDVTVSNPSTVNQVFTLNVLNVPEDWRYFFKSQDNKEINSVQVASESSETLSMTVKPPIDAEVGVFPVSVIAESPSLSGTLTLNVKTTGNYEGTLLISSLYDKITAGEPKEIEIRVQNTGYSVLTDVRLLLDVKSSTVQAEVTPFRVESLSPGETATYTLILEAIEGTATGDFVVDVEAVCSEAELDSKQIRVTVEMGNMLLLGTVVMVLAAIGSVVVLNKKIRRR